MAGATVSVKGVLVYFPTPILPNIEGEPTRKGLIYLHQLFSGNMESVALKIGGVQHGHIALIMTAEYYKT